LLVGALLGLLIFAPKTVYACSGGVGEPPFTSTIRNSGVIVKGRVLQTDDMRQNNIVRVESYIAGGSGPRYLVVSQQDPVVIRAILEGRLGNGDCNRLKSPLPVGEDIYLLLNRNVTGAYTLANYGFDPDGYGPFNPPYFYQFDNVNTTFDLLGDNRTTYQSFNEVEFLTLIAETRGESPQSPRRDAPYPALAPLHITTDVGTQVMLPLDGGEPVALTQEVIQELSWNQGETLPENCLTLDCATFSSTGIDFAQQIDTDLIRVNYYYGLAEIPGTSFLFSPTGTAIAVWNKDELQVYELLKPILGESIGFNFYDFTLINTTSINELTVASGHGAWSPDGTLLVYSDSQGLWLWDAFNEGEPRLLIEAESEPVYPQGFSSTGRYLRISQNGQPKILDLLTQKRLPDGLVSPDEQFLLAYDTTQSMSSLSICTLAPYECAPTEHQIRKADWLNEHTYVYIACEDERRESCLAQTRHFQNTYISDFNIFSNWMVRDEPGYDFAWEPVGETLAVVSDPTTVNINGVAHSLQGQLDGDIAAIEWMRPVFYTQ
jgi:hypothetical protein